MARRLPVIPLLAVVLLLVAASGHARHTAENVNHAVEQPLETQMRLWLHCEDDGACEDPGQKTFTGEETSGAHEDRIADALASDGSVAYTFSEADLGTGFTFPRTYGSVDVDATLRFRWEGGWDLEIRLETDDGDVLATETGELQAADTPSGVAQDDREFDLGAIDLPRGENLRIAVHASAKGDQVPQGAEVLLVADHESSRLDLQGELVDSQLWTHDAAGAPKDVFRLDADEEDRRILATHVLTSAFGADGLSLADGTLRGRHDGSLVDLKPNASGRVITLEHVESSGPEQVWRVATSWNYSSDLDPGVYELEGRLESNRGDRLQDRTTLTLGAGIDISVRGLDEREVRPGENATYRLVVSSQAAEDLEVDLHLDGSGTWEASVSSPTIVVPSEGERIVDMRVTPAETAQDGDERTVSIEADPQDRPDLDPVATSVTTRAVDETRLEPQIEVVEEPEGRIAPEGERSFTVAIVNNGTVRDDLFMTRGDLPEGWTASFDTDTFSLDPGKRQQIEVTVHAPRDAEVDSEHEIPVQAHSAGAADASVETSVTMTVGVLIDFDVSVMDRIRVVPQDDVRHILYRYEVTSRSNVETEFGASPGDHACCNAETFRDNPLALEPGETGEGYVQVQRKVGSPLPCATPVPLRIEPDGRPDLARSVGLFACPSDDEDFEVRDLLVEPRADPDGDGVFEETHRVRVEAGGNVTLPVRVSNVGTVHHDSVALSLAGAPSGWTAEAPDWDDPAIEPYSGAEASGATCGWFCASTEIELAVPGNATAGLHEITVTANSKDARQATGSFTYLVEVPAERNVTLGAVNRSLTVQPGGDALFNLVVENRGNVRETVDMSVDADQLPGDWTMRPVPGTLEVPPNTARYVTAIISPPTGASAGQTGEMTVTATAPFGFNETVDLTATTASASDVELSSSFSGGSVEPGTAIPYEVVVTNQAPTRSTIDLGASGVPTGFNVSIRQAGTNVSSVELDGGASTNVTVRIHVPEDAAGLVGTVVDASINGTSGRSTLTLNATIHATHDIRLEVSPRRQVVPAGQGAEYIATVHNRGTAQDTVTICIPDLAGACHQTVTEGEWAESLGQTVLTIPAKDSRSVLLTVVPDGTALPGSERTTPLTAVSTEASSERSSRRVTTAVLERDVGFGSGDGPVGAAPGQTVTANPILENRGNDGDVFAIEIVDAPAGWSVDAVEEVRLQAGASGPVPIQVVPPRDAEQGIYGIQVRAFSKLDPTVSAETTTTVRVADFRTRDVDDDGEPEFVVDANDDPADGFESFTEVSETGIRTEVVKAGAFGDTVRTGFILRTQVNPVTVYRFWGPDGGVLTNVTAARILGPDRLGYLVDVDGDGDVEFMYDEGADAIVAATSVQGRDAYLVDGDGDGTMDIYYNHDRGITTTTGDHPGEDVAVDEDGDGSYDLVVNSATGATHAFSPLDAVARAVLLYGWLFLLGIGAIVLADVVFLVRVKGGSS